MKVENEMALPITKSVTVMLLEPYAGKLARTVLRGESSRKGADLLDYPKKMDLEVSTTNKAGCYKYLHLPTSDHYNLEICDNPSVNWL